MSAKNLKDLENEYTKDKEIQNYKFLKQYLTLHRAELFFADKAIFIEGDTERILLPAMMKKIDQDNPDNPLLSQNISIVEVGNYSHIFEKFIDFFGIKSLIITDIDSAKTIQEDNETKTIKCKVDSTEEAITTNASLKFFYEKEKISDYKDKKVDTLTLSKKEETDTTSNQTTKKWKLDTDGKLVCVYQTKEKNSDTLEYHARSFEDSFFHLNRQFIIDNKVNFKSLKHIAYFEEKTGTSYAKDAYELAENCIYKKPPFAIEILLNSDEDFSNWKTPDYINQGLLWLKD